MGDYLRKVIERHGTTPFCELSAEVQAVYLGALAQRGAEDALKAIGLHDSSAAADIRDIRDLLRGLRVLKQAAWTAAFEGLGRVIGWAAIGAVAALLLNSDKVRAWARLLAP